MNFYGQVVGAAFLGSVILGYFLRNRARLFLVLWILVAAVLAVIELRFLPVRFSEVMPAWLILAINFSIIYALGLLGFLVNAAALRGGRSPGTRGFLSVALLVLVYGVGIAGGLALCHGISAATGHSSLDQALVSDR